MKKIVIIAIGIIILRCALLFGAEIRIPKFVKTDKEKVCLKDIAYIRGSLENPEWKNIVLVHITTPDTTIELPAGYIRARLRLNGVPLNKINLRLPRVVRIKREGIRITKRDLEEIAKHCIEKNNPWGKGLHILDIRATKSILLPKGKISYSCQLLRSPVGNFSVPVIFFVNGRIIDRTWVMAKTRLFIPVVVARLPIKRGEIITEDKLRLMRKDIRNSFNDVFTRKKDLLGKRAKTNIGIGEIIRREMVEVPPVIRRGERVTIVAESNTLKITAPGIAKQDGRIGETIRVQNILSKKIITGSVINDHTVKVNF